MNKFIYLFLLSCTLLINSAYADEETISIDDLIAQDKLRVSLSVPSDKEQIVGQAVVISIQVATQRWFATGSQIQSFEVPNAVMQANNIITINGSERINNEPWATQTHEITLYPTVKGRYQLPSIDINVSVNTEINGTVVIVKGVVTTEPSDFEISLPDELVDIKQFIVSPDVTLNIDGEFDQENAYAIGEAITQTITITAIDLPAMMIPELARNKEGLTGISVYHKPAQVFDKANRGVSIGTRVESYTYIFETLGTYTIEEKIIYWWNTQSSTLEQLIIPASTWSVVNAGSGSTISSQSLLKNLKDVKLTLTTVITLLITTLLLLACYYCYRHKEKLINFYKKQTHFQQRELRENFLQLIKDKDYIRADKALYQYCLLQNKQYLFESSPAGLLSIKSSPEYKKLNQLAFSSSIDDKKNNDKVSFSQDEAKTLISLIDTNVASSIKTSNFPPHEHIKLN